MRPSDNSLKYYSQDTTDDDNLQYVEAVHGLVGYAIVHKLWKKIYGGPGGYYCEWKEINQRLFCKDNGITFGDLNKILATCYSDGIEIFSKTMADDKGVLTSKGVQKRWLKIVKECGRKHNTISETYRLIYLQPVTPKETTPPPQLNGTETPQSIVKYSIIKENYVNRQSATHLPTETNNSSISDVKKEKKVQPRRNLPTGVKEVDAYMFEKMKNFWDSLFISRLAHKFFNFYTANGWKQGKDKPIISWVHAANLWIFRELEKSNTGGFVKIDHTRQPKEDVARATIKTEIRTPTPEEIEKLQLEFIEDMYSGFKTGEIEELELATGIYDVLVEKSLIMLSDEDKKKILTDCNNDSKLCKKRSIANYFKQLKEQNVNKVFQLVN